MKPGRAVCEILCLVSVLVLSGSLAYRQASADVHRDSTVVLMPNLRPVEVVPFVAFSPNGKLLATGGGYGDPAARLWDRDTGRLLRVINGSNADASFNQPTGALAFSSDGSSAVTGHDDGRLLLWDIATGRVLRQYKTQHGSIYSVAISNDGRQVAATEEGGLEVFDIDNPEPAFSRSTEAIGYSAIEPYGTSWVATSWSPGRVLIWNPGNGTETEFDLGEDTTTVSSLALAGRIVVVTRTEVSIRDFGNRLLARIPVGKQVPTVSAISSDGRYVVLGYREGTIEFRDAASLKLLRSVTLRGNIETIGFSSAEPTLLAVGLHFGISPIVLVDARPDQIARNIGASIDPPGAASFLPKGNAVLLAPLQGPIALWRIDEGRSVMESVGEGPVYSDSIAVSADGQLMVVDSEAGTRLWNLDAKAGSLLQRNNIESHSACLGAQAFFPATHKLVTTDGSGRVLILDLDRRTRSVLDNSLAERRRCIAISGDGGLIAVSDEAKATVSIWDAGSGRRIRDLTDIASNIGGVAFSPDGSRIAVVRPGEGLSLLDTRTGASLQTIDVPMLAMAFFPDGRRLVFGRDDGEIAILDYTTGKIERSFYGHVARIRSLHLSDDAKLMVSASDDGSTKLWDVESGKLIQTIVLGREGGCSADTKASRPTGGAKNTDRPAIAPCWMSFDADGRFDSSALESTSMVSWVVGDDPFRALSPEIFMRDYYEPNLLGRVLACHEAEVDGKNTSACAEAFKPVRPLASLNRIQPDVRIVGVKAGPTADVALVEVEASGKVDASQPNGKTSTGVYDVRLFRDGQLVGQWPEPKDDDAIRGSDLDAWRRVSQVEMAAGMTSARHVFAVRLAGADRGKKATFTAYGFNEDRVKSATVSDDGYTVPPTIALPAKPRAYIVTVGVNEYENPALRLNFAAADAGAIETALQGIKGYDVVPVLLTSDYARTEGERRIPAVDHASKADIRAVLDLLAGKGEAERSRLRQEIGPVIDRLSKATPDDLVILAFSGHGHTEQGRFYILPSDSGGDLARLDKMISSEELTAWLRDVDAGEMVMIVDACHSAAGVPAGFKPGPMGDRGLGQLAYDKGMRILAATQADDVALESGSLGQGLLTYALKEGLTAGSGRHRLADTDGNGAITMKEWLTYAENRVPGLYQDVLAGKVQKTRDSSPDPNLLEDTTRHAQTPALFDFFRASAQDPVIAFR